MTRSSGKKEAADHKPRTSHRGLLRGKNAEPSYTDARFGSPSFIAAAEASDRGDGSVPAFHDRRSSMKPAVSVCSRQTSLVAPAKRARGAEHRPVDAPLARCPASASVPLRSAGVVSPVSAAAASSARVIRFVCRDRRQPKRSAVTDGLPEPRSLIADRVHVEAASRRHHASAGRTSAREPRILQVLRAAREAASRLVVLHLWRDDLPDGDRGIFAHCRRRLRNGTTRIAAAPVAADPQQPSRRLPVREG